MLRLSQLANPLLKHIKDAPTSHKVAISSYLLIGKINGAMFSWEWSKYFWKSDERSLSDLFMLSLTPLYGGCMMIAWPIKFLSSGYQWNLKIEK